MEGSPPSDSDAVGRRMGVFAVEAWLAAGGERTAVVARRLVAVRAPQMEVVDTEASAVVVASDAAFGIGSGVRRQFLVVQFGECWLG